MDELTPLDQIRRAEAEAARRIAAAKVSAEEAVRRAQQQAATIKRQAREGGRRAGQAQYQQTVALAKKEADVLVENADGRAESLRRSAQLQMDAAVRLAIDVIIGLEGDASRPDGIDNLETSA
jgi:vacuolar-type H+-ATPase subunit H